MKQDKEKNQDEKINVLDYPEKYLEINIIHKDNFRLVETVYAFVKDKEFEHGGKKYNIDSKAIFIIPSKKSFVQTSYYIEGNPKPILFDEKNKGIPCNALSLLWNYKLYSILMDIDKKELNWILIILLIASLVAYAFGLYYHYTGGNLW